MRSSRYSHTQDRPKAQSRTHIYHEDDVPDPYRTPLSYRPSLEIPDSNKSYQTAAEENFAYGVRPSSPANFSAKVQERFRGKIADPLGLTVWHEPQIEPIADVVLLHGIGGGSRQTWSHEDGSQTFWPMDWLPSEPIINAARISTYGYHSQLSSNDPDRLFDFTDFAKALLAQLRFGTGRGGRSLNVGRTPIFFVAHSLGGLVAKKAYILAQSENNADYLEIAEAITAFVFLSTPHGSHMADVLNNVLSACVLGWTPTEHGLAARRNLPALQAINDQFRNFLPYVHVFSFYETMYTMTGNRSEIMILNQESATLGPSMDTSIPLVADHFGVARFKSRSDPSYISVRDVIKHLVEKFKPRRRTGVIEDVSGQTKRVNSLLGHVESPEDDLSTISDRRVIGSCEWILDNVIMDAFLTSQSAAPQCLWCYGNAGTGKSILATYLIEHLENEGHSLAYYFFSSGDQVKNYLSTFLVSVAWQLAGSVPEYRRKLSDLSDEAFDVGKAKPRMLWRKFFVSTLFKCDIQEPIFLVIDGLDELGDTRELLQKMIPDLSSAQNPLRLLLISRPTTEIEDSIDRLGRRVPLSRLGLDGNNEDLRLYVQEEMASMNGSDAFKNRIKAEVLRKANGNFLWAHLVVKEIVECQTEEQVNEALRAVPKDLEPLYERMDTLLADTYRSRPQDKSLGHTILGWTACSRKPLSLDELKDSLASDVGHILDMRQTISRLCRDFVVIDKKGFVRMTHSSARDYVLRNKALNYYVDPESTHQVLFAKCLHEIRNSGYRHNGPEGTSFYSYATASWPFHLTQSAAIRDQKSLVELVMLFRHEAVLSWMASLAEAGNLRALVEASKALTEFIKLADKADKSRSPLEHKLNDKDMVSAWAQDLIRIVGKFGAQMYRTPKALYSLIPAFCPSESRIYEQFAKSHMSLPIKVSGNPSSNWDDCFSKFSIPGDALPRAIFSMGRYFAIVTKDDGIVHLYYVTTCEEARQLQHNEIVLAFCHDINHRRLVTCGLKQTKIWDVSSGRLIATVDNPSNTKALAIAFRQDHDDDLRLVCCFEDRSIRRCSPDALENSWKPIAGNIGSEVTRGQRTNAPRMAKFSHDGQYLAFGFRGIQPIVLHVGDTHVGFVSQCVNRSSSAANINSARNANFVDVLAMSWNPLTGHLIGIYNDGTIFKWHPVEGSLESAKARSTHVKCSGDGKLFVTGSVDGTLRIWDFDHFAPIYQLRYPTAIQDIEISSNEARIYDIREQYCNIWEPNALIRVLESDDRASDVQSNKDSNVPSLTSDIIKEDFEPLTVFAAHPARDVYVTGDIAGIINVCDHNGATLDSQDLGPMSVEAVAWSSDGNMFASADLAREVRVSKCAHGHVSSNSKKTFSFQLVVAFTEQSQITQLLFSPDNSALMVVTTEAVKMYSVDEPLGTKVIPSVKRARWILHPSDSSTALGIAADSIRLLSWHQPENSTTLNYDRGYLEQPSTATRPTLLPDGRRQSQAWPSSPSEIYDYVNKLCLSPDGRQIFVEIFSATRQVKKRTQCLLLDTERIEAYRHGRSIPVTILAQAFIDQIHVSLGLVAPKHSVSIPRNLAGQRGDGPRLPHRRDGGPSTFTFINREFWICSAEIGGNQAGVVGQVRRHFFLPRDWQNTEHLEMASVTPDGQFLCPRNGYVALVSNGMVEEWKD